MEFDAFGEENAESYSWIDVASSELSGKAQYQQHGHGREVSMHMVGSWVVVFRDWEWLHWVHGAYDAVGEKRGGCSFEDEYAHQSMTCRVLPCQ